MVALQLLLDSQPGTHGELSDGMVANRRDFIMGGSLRVNVLFGCVPKPNGPSADTIWYHIENLSVISTCALLEESITTRGSLPTRQSQATFGLLPCLEVTALVPGRYISRQLPFA